MPRVEDSAEVTLAVLVYRSTAWLDFVMQQVESTKQETPYRWLVVANDATHEVRSDPRVSVDFMSSCHGSRYPHNIGGIYEAWNEAVLQSRTEAVILMNSDMVPYHWAIDALMAESAAGPCLPCGLLVENGRIISGMPELVRNFGTNPDNFDAVAFQGYAKSLSREPVREPGRLFMPVLVNRQEFLDLGGYPAGNFGGVSGDRALFRRYEASGFKWVTRRDSIWYHFQEGETRWP